MRELLNNSEAKANEFRIRVKGRIVQIIAAIKARETHVENPDYLQEAITWFKNGNSLVFSVIPHTSPWDGAVVEENIVYPYFTPLTTKNHAWLISAKFTENIEGVPSMGITSQGTREYAEVMQFQTLPVVHPNYITEENKEAAQRQNFSSLYNARHILKRSNSIVAICAEATREDQPELLRAHPGVGSLIKGKKTAVLPIIIDGVDEFQSRENQEHGLRGINFKAGFTVRLGKLLHYQQALEIASRFRWKIEWGNKDEQEFTVADAVMLHSTQSLLYERDPQINPLGVYAPKNMVQLY